MRAIRLACIALVSAGLMTGGTANAAIGFVPSKARSVANTADRTSAHCSIVPELAAAERISPVSMKGGALLDEQPSALAKIIQQQNGQVSKAGLAPLEPIASLSPTNGNACPGRDGFAPSSRPFGIPMIPSGSSRPPTNVFLSSGRVPIGHTPFDGAWDRVSRSHLSHTAFTSALGRNSVLTAVGEDELLRRVNAWANRNIRYVEDRQQYGRDDYWADAATTLKRRAGDCEDIAILKMQLLEAAGIAPSNLFLTIAHDPLRNGDHAVLVIKSENGFRLLDNNTDLVLPGDVSPVLQPMFSFSEAHKWLHGFVR